MILNGLLDNLAILKKHLVGSLCRFLVDHELPLELCIRSEVVLLIYFVRDAPSRVHGWMLHLDDFEFIVVIVPLDEEDAVLSEEGVWVGVLELLEREFDRECVVLQIVIGVLSPGQDPEDPNLFQFSNGRVDIMNYGLASWSLASCEFRPSKVFHVGENSLLNERKAGHVVLVSRALDLENISDGNVLVIEIGRRAVFACHLRELIQVGAADDDNVFLQLPENSVVEVWVILLLIKCLDLLPHLFIFFVFVLISLILLHLTSLPFHVLERCSHRGLTPSVERGYSRSLLDLCGVEALHLIGRCNLLCDLPS